MRPLALPALGLVLAWLRALHPSGNSPVALLSLNKLTPRNAAPAQAALAVVPPFALGRASETGLTSPFLVAAAREALALNQPMDHLDRRPEPVPVSFPYQPAVMATDW